VPPDLLQSIGSNLWSVFLIILFFGGSIFVHELGHFLAARRRGVHVDRFSIGFGPKIFAWHGRDGVEYRISWLPIGGYVALPQLADMGAVEGDSKVEIERLPPISYGTKMIVFAAGAAFNVLFAFLLACVVWWVGQPTSSELNTTKIGAVLPTITLPDHTSVPGPAFEAGFRAGDIVRSIDGHTVTNWTDLHQTLFSGSGRSADGRPKAVFTIDRDGQTLDLTVYPRLSGDEGSRYIGIASAQELVIGAVDPALLGHRIGLQPGDRIVAYDSIPLLSQEDFLEHLSQNHTRTIRLEILRSTERHELELPARADQVDLADLGIKRQSSFMVTHPDPIAQLQDNAVMIFRLIAGLINPQSDLGVSKLSGPVGIIRIFRATAQSDIRLVLWFTILINVNLAIFNLLPIPVLDGGHMLFATIERLRSRALPADFIMTTQGVFMVLLFSLILYVSVFDVKRWVRDVQSDRAETQTPATMPPKAAATPAAP
jgi:regulator of sigma E protease